MCMCDYVYKRQREGQSGACALVCLFPHSLGPRGGFAGQIGLGSLSLHNSDGDKESAVLRSTPKPH